MNTPSKTFEQVDGFLKELLEYSHFYNQKLTETFLLRRDNISERAIKLFSHLLNAHHIWNSRIVGKESMCGVWDIQLVQEMKAMDDSNFGETVFILDNYKLDTMIYYQNTKGQRFNNRVGDILFHIVNHSTYHRGQLATEFRQIGIEPINTDYIFFKR